MGIITILTALAASSYATALARAKSADCTGNLNQWGVALQLYMNDNDGYLPRRGQGVQALFVINRPTDWFNCLPPYLGMKSYDDLYTGGQAPHAGQKSIFVCPEAVSAPGYTYFIAYGMNMYLSRWDQPNASKIGQLPNISTLAFLSDSPGGYASTVPSANPYSVQARHSGRANVVFVDGHVQSFSGTYLGCGSGPVAQPDVHWQTGVAGDTWGASL
jgi:prepilin-type processing-associated H-X9-DG protein